MIQLLASFYAFMLGLCAGSFLNAFLWRLERGESAMKGRSRCPHCSHVLLWNDLIPVVSFLLLSGTCRYCKKPISWEYPLGEIVGGILFVSVFIFVFEGQVDSLIALLYLSYLLFISVCLLGVFLYDLKHYLIPDRILFLAICTSFLWYAVAGISGFVSFSSLGFNMLGAVFASAFFFFLHAVSRGTWMGFADGKLVFLLGLLLSPDLLIFALFAAFCSGALLGIMLIIFRKKSFASQVPFGPFLVGGAFAALFWGKTIVEWYRMLLTGI